MRNNYRFLDYRDIGLPCVQVYGSQFHYQDLYEMVGKDQFMTTFQLRRGSEAQCKYGHSVLGVMFYDWTSLASLKESSQISLEITKQLIGIDCRCRNLSEEKKRHLKHQGINVEEIESISFLPYIKGSEKYETGEKKVPDIIEIEIDSSDVDFDVLNQNLLVIKHESGTKLVQYEKEQLIGITFAFNNGCIDSRYLEMLGFTETDCKTNLNIWMSYYKVKERRNLLSDFDKNNYAEVKSILSLERFNKIVNELTRNGLTDSFKGSDLTVLKNIFEVIEKFSPSILLQGENQVYWDIDSYIHIALRHLKDYQLGNFREKTPFSYKAGELESLIEKVLQQIEPEIEAHLVSKPTKDFNRHGTMAVFYNGDHYNLMINPGGRLAQFHAKSAFNNSVPLATGVSSD